MCRVIKEAKPRWIIGENVAGFVNMGLDDCLSDLESEGYETTAFIIPACAVNAPHRRDRVWIVANHEGRENNRRNRRILAETEGRRGSGNAAACVGDQVIKNPVSSRDRGWSNGDQAGGERSLQIAESDCDAANTQRVNRRPGLREDGQEQDGDQFTNGSGYAANSGNERLQGSQRPGTHEQRQAAHGPVAECHSAWDEPWIEAASRLCKLYDGLPDRLVRYSLTYPETHHIMGFVLTLRRYHYGTSEEKRTKEILPFLRGAFAEESVQRCFGRLSEVFKEENLQCAVHGKDDGKRKENEVCVSESSFKIQEEPLQELRHNRKPIRSSQRRELEKQCSCEFDDIVCELSHEIALGEWKRNTETAHNVLFDMWQESRGERFLHEPLSALHEIWKSVTNKEVGSFRRHLNFRDKDRTHRLKALGNAIVPQVAYEIMKAIVLVDDL